MPPSCGKPRGPPARRRALAFAFVSGFAITAVEFAAVRLFAPFFGQSPLVWANVIGVVLIALAIGYAAGGRLAERDRVATDLVRVSLVSAAAIGVTPFFGPRCARWLLPEGFAGGPDLSAAALASFVATALVFTIPLAGLGALSPLVQRATSGDAPIGRFAGLTMAASTLGAVAGGYATTLYLLPALGTRATLLSCAAGLAIAARLVAAPRSGVLALLGAIALGFAAPELERPSKGPGLPGDHVVFERDGPIQCVRVLDREDRPPWLPGESFRVRLLALDEGDAEYHSVAIAGRPDTLGRYYDLFPLLPELLERPREPVSVLILGFAAGTAYRVLDHALGARLRLTGVEIDPLVLEVGHRHFAVPRDDPRLELVCADARVFLRGLEAETRYDVVVVDCYAQQQYVPFHLATIEFFREVRAHLADDGVLAVNLDARTALARFPAAVARSVRAAGFGSVLLLPLPAFPSEVLVARESEKAPWLPRRLPREPFADVAFAAWTRRHAAAWGFDPPVLSDDHAPVERLVEHSLARPEPRR
jgi:spermidine synthase